MNFKIINNDATLIELRDIKKMLRIGDKMAFKNKNSYKVMNKILDIHTIKVGVKIEGKKKAMDYRHVKVLFNLDRKIID